MDIGYQQLLRLNYIENKKGEQIEAYVQLYAPCSNNCTEEQNNEFLNELLEVKEKVEHNNMLYVTGDFNGRVGTN